MKLFGKKKAPQVQETKYEIFGGLTILKKPAGYEITWRSPNLTTITVRSPPVIGEGVEVKHEADKIQVMSTECRLTLTAREGDMEAQLSKF